MNTGPSLFGNTPKDRQRERDMLTQAHDQEERPNQHGGSYKLRAEVSTSETWADECAGGKPVPELLLTPGTLAPTMHLPYTCRT
jgi:hypothetical protein